MTLHALDFSWLTNSGASAAAAWVAAFAALCQTGILLFAGIFAYNQVKAARAQLAESRKELAVAEKSRRDASAFLLLARVGDHKASKLRRRLYRTIANNISDPSKKDERALGRIVNDFEALGYMVNQGVIDPDLILGLHYSSIIRTWECVEPWVLGRRGESQPNYGRWYEHLYNSADEYCSKNFPGARPRVWIGRP
jgi:hypothetical protein